VSPAKYELRFYIQSKPSLFIYVSLGPKDMLEILCIENISLPIYFTELEARTDYGCSASQQPANLSTARSLRNSVVLHHPVASHLSRFLLVNSFAYNL
jgi:hypothetical protein